MCGHKQPHIQGIKTVKIGQLTQAEKERKILRQTFVEKQYASLDSAVKMGNDASFRSYYRLNKPSQTLLMDSPAAHEPVAPFVKIAEHLSSMGLRAPEIKAQDLTNNFLLIEDFGDDTFSRLMDATDSAEEIEAFYRLAVDALVKTHKDAKATWVEIDRYTTDKFIDETGRTINWFYPLIAGKKPDAVLKKRWVDAWRTVLDACPDVNDTLVLRDFHCDNLMLVKDKNDQDVCGLLDFQDALLGPSPYDLVSLLENDRRAVPEDMQARLLAYYKSEMGIDVDSVTDKSFMHWYRVLSAQRQSKILGLFYRLYMRDGKRVYLNFIPQVCNLLKESLKDPILKPVADLYTEIFGELRYIDITQDEATALIAIGLDDDLPLNTN